MKSKSLVLSAVLLGMGTVLHLLTPSMIMGVKPDFLLVMMFMCLYLIKDMKSALIISVSAGTIAALTTGFPMGQLPNILDKLVTGFLVFQVFKIRHHHLTVTQMGILVGVGTLVSGLIFLSSGFFLLQQMEMVIPSLPIVIITMPINAGLAMMVYKSLVLSLTKGQMIAK